ncbi:unnamed protein product [Brassica oleracea var. botrytis]
MIFYISYFLSCLPTRIVYKSHVCIMQGNLVWYYNNALGRPEKKKFIARKKSWEEDVSCHFFVFLPVLHQNFDLPAPYVLHTDCPHYCRFHLPGKNKEDFSIRLAKNLEDRDQKLFMDTKRGFKGHAEPLSKERIKELIENGTLKKSVTWMEREIHSGEVPHAKAVAKSFEKPCAKSKSTILSTMSDHDSETESLPNSQSPVKASTEKPVQLNYAVFFAYISLREKENMNLMCCSSSNATKYGGVRKIELVTLAELNSFVLNASPQ